MSRAKRMKQGDTNFLKYVAPAIKPKFPGQWISTNGMKLDYESGLDFINVHLAKTTTFSSRVWESFPMQHFAIRHYRTSAPDRPLEVSSRLEALKQDKWMTDWTVEGFIYRKTVYVAAIPTRTLWTVVDKNLDRLQDFCCHNEDDMVVFRRVPFNLLGPELFKITMKFSRIFD